MMRQVRQPAVSRVQIDHFVMAITSPDANGRHNYRRCKNHERREMMTLGPAELVLVLIALGGMTAAATWGAIELKRPRR
jgi:hypothetical protein